MKLLETKRKPPEIPIIALIDILAILLIFFIVSTTFKKPRPVLEIDLPTVKKLPTTQIADQRSTIAVDKDGIITLDLVKVEIEKLAEYLKAFKNVNPDAKLELEADREMNIDLLLRIWAALSEANIEIKDVPARIELPAQ